MQSLDYMLSTHKYNLVVPDEEEKDFFLISLSNLIKKGDITLAQYKKRQVFDKISEIIAYGISFQLLCLLHYFSYKIVKGLY